MTLLRLFINTCLFFSVAKAYPNQTCLDLLSLKNTSEVINFPSELKVKSRTSTVLGESGHAELLKTLASLFEAIRDPVLIDLTRNSFRIYNFKFMPPTTEELDIFSKYWDNAPSILVKDTAEEKIKHAYFALKRNLDSAYLSEKEIFYTATLITQSSLRIQYKTNRSMEFDKNSLVPSERSTKILEGFLQTLENRRQWSNTINDSNFRKIFLDYEAEEKSTIQRSPSTVKVFNEIKSSKKIQIEKNLKSLTRLKVFIGNALSITLKEVFGIIEADSGKTYETILEELRAYNNDKNIKNQLYSVSESYNDTLDKLMILKSSDFDFRLFFLDALESVMIDYQVDQRNIESFIDFMDSYIFDVKKRFTATETIDALVTSAKRTLLPLKSETYKTLSTSDKEEPKSSQKKTPDSLQIVYNQDWYPNQRKDSFSTRKNPKKRNNKSNTNDETLKSQSLSDKEDLIPKNTSGAIPLTADANLEPGVLYSFSFLRHPEKPEQTIIFNEETLNDLKKHNLRQSIFIQPLLNGFTAENGRNGIRNLTTKKKHKDKHEIKPGNSSFRVLMKREGSHWQSLFLSHKNKIDWHVTQF